MRTEVTDVQPLDGKRSLYCLRTKDGNKAVKRIDLEMENLPALRVGAVVEVEFQITLFVQLDTIKEPNQENET